MGYTKEEVEEWRKIFSVAPPVSKDVKEALEKEFVKVLKEANENNEEPWSVS